MKIKTLFFGIAKDIVCKNSLWIELNNDATIADLIGNLKTMYPKFSSINEFSMALNEEYVEHEAKLKEDDIVAIIPPVSGG